jgi:nitroreductase
MDVRDALINRKSVRAFLDREVSSEIIERILDAARWAPSGVNTQPWQVAVVRGDTKRALQERLESSFHSGAAKAMDYQYYPAEWTGVYRERRKACGLQLFSTLQISRADKDRQTAQWAANYRAFDAPVMLFFFMDRELGTGSFLDYGMFLQSLMLAAVEEGLATCAQAALGEYPAIVKEMLGYPDDSMLIGGMALGYEDADATVNSYRTPREEVHAFTQFFD